MKNLRIGLGVSSIGRFLPYIGQAAGLFEKNDIAVEIVNQQDEEQVVTDMISGVTPIATPNAPSLLFSLLEGNDLVIVGGVLNRPAFYLVGHPSVKTVADLKGKRVGINQPKRMAGMVMLALLRRWGFDTARDLTLLELGLNDKSFEALQQGEMDAALLPPEKAFLAAAQGLTVIADSLELDCHWVPLATTRQFLTENRELVSMTVKIYQDSIQLFQNDPQGTLQEIGRWLPALEKHPAVLEQCYKVFAQCFEPTLEPSLPSLASILQEVALQDPRAAKVLPSALVAQLD